jgi:4-amino-4-deoxy-L-arabinose transferase-like glycosyltransferase
MTFEDVQNPAITISLGRNRTIYLSETTILVVILILGGILRFAALGRWSLWTDELYNLGLMPVSARLAEGIPADQHPPLYYLLLEQVLRLGRSEWLMRLPSALAGLLTVPIMWRVGVALKRPQLGFLAAALLAIAPLHIWYSREARMYSLAMFFWAAAVYFYIQSWRRDNWLDTLGLVLTMAGGLYTAYPTLALWFIQVALFFPFCQLSGGRLVRLGRWAAAQFAIGALFYAWQPFLQRQLERPTVFNWLNFFEPVLGGQTAARLTQWLEQSGLTTTLAGTFQLALGVGLLVVLVSWLLSLLVVRWPSIPALVKRWEFLIATLITFLFLLITAAGAVPRGLSLRRQLLVFWIPFLPLAAWALLRLRDRWIAAVVVLMSLLLSLYTAFGLPYEDWRSTAVVISEQGRPGDLVLITPSWSTMAFDYYYLGDVSYQGANIQQARNDEAALDNARRVWLVVNRHPAMAGQTMEIERWFMENGRVLMTYEYPQYLTVYEMAFGD